jgi:16S rRNA (adenine1518-N6/adenine1519-N6)-dimethyltransferase
MLQREVADRVSAPPGSGDYGPLSIAVRLWADVDRLLELPPGAFRPPPRVHSSVVRLTFRPPAIRPADPRTFDALVRAAFTQRRKTMLNAVRAFATGRGQDAGALLARAGLDPGRRPQTLALADWIRLADSIGRPVDGGGESPPML